MKKIFALLIGLCLFGALLIVVCIFGYNTKDSRPYFYGYAVNPIFAQKLRHCQSYEVPVRYKSIMSDDLWDLFFPKYKDKVKIIGMDEKNGCVIRSYEAKFLSPIWKKSHDYYLPKYLLPYFADIFETAFSETAYHEMKAVEMVHSFCHMHRDFCKDADTPPYSDKDYDIYGNTYFSFYIRNLTAHFVVSDIPD